MLLIKNGKIKTMAGSDIENGSILIGDDGKIIAVGEGITAPEGCTVIDVIVEHPIYGQITGPLELSNRYDVSQFLLRSAQTQPLSVLTEGIHLHTLSCPDEAAFTRVQNALRALGVLLEE